MGLGKRTVAAGLSLGLALLSPGLAPYEALAANVAAVTQVNSPAGVAIPGMGVLPADPAGILGSMRMDAAPTLQGSLSGISLPALQSRTASPQVQAQAAASVSAVQSLEASAPAALRSASGIQAKAKLQTQPSPQAVKNGRSIAASLSSLSQQVAAVRSQETSAGIGAKTALDLQFDGGGLRTETVSPTRAQAPAILKSGLRRAAAEDTNAAPTAPAVETQAATGSDTPGREAKAQPAQKISRAIRIGALTAILMLAVDMVAMAAATTLGYHMAPSYEMPALANPEAFAALGSFLAPIAAKVQSFLMAAWVAPYNEEVYFRAGVIGVAAYSAMKSTRWVARMLEKISPKLKGARAWVTPAAFGMAATQAAMLFALLHEVSDPLLITVRIAQALLFSYLYSREGLTSGIAHHAVFNGLAILTLPLVYGAGGAFLTMPGYIIGAALTAALLALWKFTRPAAKKEAEQLRAGTLAPYRINARSSRILGIAGWVTVAALAGLAAIQANATATFLLGAMAAQVAPAAIAFGAYGYLLRNLEKREGPEAVRKITDPDSPLPMGNRMGAWVGGLFGAMYLGIIAGSLILGASVSLIPMFGMTGSSLVVAAVPALIAAGIMVYRWTARHRGISPWVYLTQYFFATMAALVASVPWLAPLVEKLAASTGNLGPAMVMPALSAMTWTLPVFLVLSVLMTFIGKAVMKRYPPRDPD